jgi:rhodanese-related sulfurtransferase
VNEYLQTSDPNIYAVGDAIEFENPITKQSMNTYLAGPANKQGRICANNLVNDNTQMYKGAINTAIVKVFDMTVATAGTASKHLQTAQIHHIVSTTHSGSHAGYYPGSQQMTIQIGFEPKTGKLFNAQIAGYDGVDKRMEMFSQAIKNGDSIFDLMEIEHAYAPPFSSAKDPVNIAGFVAENILLGKMKPVYWNELNHFPDAHLIDVRSQEEFESGHIPGAINMPIDQLRESIVRLDSLQSIIVYCEVGQRGYLAQRILNQHGFKDVMNLSGGYTTWFTSNNEMTIIEQQAERAFEPA